MKITQFEQSGIIIETNKGFRLAVDIAGLTPVDKLKEVQVDAMIVSHLHGDHFSLEHIKKLTPKKLYLNRECIDLLDTELSSFEIVEVKVGDTMNIDEIKVQFFDVDHGPNATVRPRENFGLLIKVDDKKIYFAGDMFYPSGISVDDLEVDVALLPVGGFYTFGPEEAFEFAKQFKSIGQCLPMHYEINLPAKDEFNKLAKAKAFGTLNFKL